LLFGAEAVDDAGAEPDSGDSDTRPPREANDEQEARFHDRNPSQRRSASHQRPMNPNDGGGTSDT
jgi:hypothetical protein